MESEGITYLIYDKMASGIHAFNNNATVDITIESIFKENLEPLEGIAAITRYNSIMGVGYQIPDDIELGIYNIYMFEYTVNNINVIITLVSVNNKKIEEYYNKHNTVPQQKFIIDTCRFHQNYMRHTNRNIASSIYDSSEIEKKVKTIIKSALEPNLNIMDLDLEQPKFLKMNLFPYQRRTVKWMINTEKNPCECRVSKNSDSEIKLGNIFYDPYVKKFLSQKDKTLITFNGGALIDEVGLGKTIESITMSLLNPSKNPSYLREDSTEIFSRATLIICPNQLCGQWTREFTKMINISYPLNIKNILTKNHFDKVSYQDLLDADFVILSYNFLGNQNFLETWLRNISTKKSYLTSDECDASLIKKEFEKITKTLYDNPIKLTEKNPILPAITWHRIIIDEFHEPYTVDKYKYVQSLIPHFKGIYKWCMSGTPFDKGSVCLDKMIDYVTNYSNNMEQKIYLNDSVFNHMKESFFRRNTKKSVEEEHKLPELKERIIWLKFSQTECMMYNAYLANSNVDKFSVLMRQLCCHPNLAEETKNILNNCKTLDDIEKMMVSHYKQMYEESLNKVNKVEKTIKIIKKKICIINYKRQRKFLRELDYKVTIEYPDFGIDDNEEEIAENIEDVENMQSINIKQFLVESDNESDYSDDREEITINETNQSVIKGIIGTKLNKNLPNILINLQDSLNNWNNRLNVLQKDLDGKTTTYNFFNNAMEKVKKTVKIEDEKNKENKDENEDDNEEELCGICMCEVDPNDIGITKCGHIFDYECLKSTLTDKPKCPMCSSILKNNEIYKISYEKKIKNPTNEIKDKLALISKVGTKLANLIYYLSNIDNHVIIFSQWDDLLRKVGLVLNDHGIKNVFCRGNVWQRDKAIREFNEKDDIRVIMLSSESAASGTNLTKATKVILLDQVYGTQEFRRNTEWQAVGRAYRMGQTKPVEIVRMIIKNSVEEDIYKENKLNDSKFSTGVIIEEINDDSLVITNDKLQKIQKSVKIAEEFKEIKNKIKKESLLQKAKKKDEKKDEQKIIKVKIIKANP